MTNTWQEQHDELLRQLADLQRQLQQAQEELANEKDYKKRILRQAQEELANEKDYKKRILRQAQTYCEECKAERDAAIERGRVAEFKKQEADDAAGMFQVYKLVAEGLQEKAEKRAEAAERDVSTLQQDVGRAEQELELANKELAEQRALAERLAERKELTTACGCVTKQGGLIYVAVCARHREQGREVGRRLGEVPAEAQEEGS